MHSVCVFFREIQTGLISEKISRRRVIVMAERLLLLMYGMEDTCVSRLQMPSKLLKCCGFQNFKWLMSPVDCMVYNRVLQIVWRDSACSTSVCSMF